MKKGRDRDDLDLPFEGIVGVASIASAFGACLSTVRCEFAEKVDKKRRRQSRKTGVVKDRRRIIPAVPSTRLPKSSVRF